MRQLTKGHFKNGWDSLRGSKWRNFWTMLGVIIGVASVIIIVSVGEGIKQQIGGQIHHLGKDLILIRPAQLKTDGGQAGSLGQLSGATISGKLSDKDIESIQKTKGISAVAPLSAVTGGVHGEDGDYHGGLIIGTSPDLPSLLNQSMAYGGFLTADDMGTNAAVLGQEVASKLFNEEVPLGRSFTFHGQEFIVHGIFNQFSAAPLSEQADFNKAIFIPYDVAQTLTNNTAPTYEILAKSSKQTAQVAAAVKAALLKNHGGQDDFNVLQENSNITGSGNVIELLTRMISVVAAISLLVGGIGIMNVMLVSVTERLHEIGIRKAIGATNRQILGQFLVEASLLSLCGGAIGIALAYGFDIGLRIFTNIRPAIGWQIVLVATGVSLLIGIVFGSIPALKAARKDPIQALRAD